MVLSAPLLRGIGLYTVWGMQVNHPTGFFGLHHEPQNPVESGISYTPVDRRKLWLF
jgi:hypothetical protein